VVFYSVNSLQAWCYTISVLMNHYNKLLQKSHQMCDSSFKAGYTCNNNVATELVITHEAVQLRCDTRSKMRRLRRNYQRIRRNYQRMR